MRGASAEFAFLLYLGFDEADPIYDRRAAEASRARARSAPAHTRSLGFRPHSPARMHAHMHAHTHARPTSLAVLTCALTCALTCGAAPVQQCALTRALVSRARVRPQVHALLQELMAQSAVGYI